MWLFSIAAAHGDLKAVGLMPGMAILELKGERLVLRQGQEKNGVKLIESSSQEALVEWQGEQQALTLGVSLTGSYKPPVQQEVRLMRHENGHYFTRVKVNGRWIEALVDTGATGISMNENVARSLGINWASGVQRRSSTAAGIVKIYVVGGNTIQVGDIVKYNLPVTVHKGNFPDITLLGMSFLNTVSMREENGVLILKD